MPKRKPVGEGVERQRWEAAVLWKLCIIAVSGLRGDKAHAGWGLKRAWSVLEQRDGGKQHMAGLQLSHLYEMHRIPRRNTRRD